MEIERVFGIPLEISAWASKGRNSFELIYYQNCSIGKKLADLIIKIFLEIDKLMSDLSMSIASLYGEIL